MIRVYYLETEIVDNTVKVKGAEYIHHATLEVEGILRKLIQDTTDDEHDGLVAVAVSWREATQAEIDDLNSIEFTPPPPPPPVFTPLPGTGIPERVEYIEQFLRKLYPEEGG